MKGSVKSESLIEFLNQKNHVDLKYNKEAIIERKEVFINKVETINEQEGTVWCTITTEDVDRQGDIVIAEGIDTSEFKKIPSIYKNHNYAEDPIGTCDEMVHKGKYILAKGRFALAVQSIKDDFEKVKAGVLRGVSIGFSADEVVLRGTKRFDDICRKMGLDTAAYEKVRRIITKWTLFEFSICGMPANASCTTKNVEVAEVAEVKEEAVEVKTEEIPVEKGCSEEEDEDKDKKKKKAKKECSEEETEKDEKTEKTEEAKGEVKKFIEVIKVIPRVNRYIKVLKTPEEEQNYIKAVVDARLRGKTKITID